MTSCIGKLIGIGIASVVWGGTIQLVGNEGLHLHLHFFPQALVLGFGVSCLLDALINKNYDGDPRWGGRV